MFESVHNFRFATGIFLMAKLIGWKSENYLWMKENIFTRLLGRLGHTGHPSNFDKIIQKIHERLFTSQLNSTELFSI